MTVQYICRHCHTLVGEIKDDSINEFQLGFHFLTPDERRDIIAYNSEWGSDSEGRLRLLFTNTGELS